MRMRTLPAVVLGAVLATVTSPASAASFFAGDLLTSNQFGLLEDRHASATLEVDFPSFMVDASWDIGAAGSGLGDAYTASARSYVHTFSAPEGATIESAWLFVSFTDDGFDAARETAVAEVEGDIFETRGIRGFLLPTPIHETLAADVTAALTNGNGTLAVAVSPGESGQDFHIQASLLKVRYSIGGPTEPASSAVPEPGGLAAFALGLVIAAAGLRGERSAVAA
ncbi:hypothetical protein MYXO_01990 [Myxococcaceae bacterium]|jgi:hypothetical protein|nr:hypothetical protein MYXO_01990 [Myxococcaceae bacterium]